MRVYEVDVLVQRAVTWRVVAESDAEARDRAIVGDGDDISGVYYTSGEVVEVRQVRMDYDEALHDAGML